MNEITTAYQAAYAEFEAAKAALETARAEGRDDSAERERYQAARAAKTAAWHAVLIEASRGKFFRVVGVDDNAEMGFMLANATGEPEESTLFDDLPEGVVDEIGVVHLGRTSRTIYKVERPAPALNRALADKK